MQIWQLLGKKKRCRFDKKKGAELTNSPLLFHDSAAVTSCILYPFREKTDIWHLPCYALHTVVITMLWFKHSIFHLEKGIIRLKTAQLINIIYLNIPRSCPLDLLLVIQPIDLNHHLFSFSFCSWSCPVLPHWHNFTQIWQLTVVTDIIFRY